MHPSVFTLQPKTMGSTIGLALSGGGIRGVAHIGLLQRLSEQAISPDLIAGSSAGAIVGALYSDGKTPPEMIRFFKETHLFDFGRLARWKPGLLNTDSFGTDLAESLDTESIEQLDIPLYITATELTKGEEIVFTSGSLIDALLASSAYPGIFVPIEIDDQRYVDGGVFNNLPANLIREQADILLGMNVTPISHIDPSEISNPFGLMKRVFELNTYKNAHRHQQLCDLCLAPPELTAYHLFETSKIDQIYEIGYDAASKHGDQILSLLDKS